MADTAMEGFEAVILAGGVGHQLEGLAPDIPKCLLPVGNRPMLWYSIRSLQAAGFDEIAVLTHPSIVEMLRSYVEVDFPGALVDKNSVTPECQGSGASSREPGPKGFRLRIVTAVDDDDEDQWPGTADALLQSIGSMSSSSSDIIVTSCDTIGHIDYGSLAAKLREGKAAFALLMDKMKPTASFNPSILADPWKDRDSCVVSFDNDEPSKLLAIKHAAAIRHGEDLDISKLQLFWSPRQTVVGDITDGHVYAIRRDLLANLDTSKVFSIQHDLLPMLATLQYTPEALKGWGKGVNNQEEDATSRLDLDCPGTAANPPARAKCGTDVSIVLNGNFVRTNTLRDYLDLNMRLCSPKEDEVLKVLPRELHPSIDWRRNGAKDSLIAESALIIAPLSSIKRSVIGFHSKISARAQIKNSVLMNKCEIQERCILQHSIVSDCAVVGIGSKLVWCRVAKGVTVPPGTIADNETFSAAQDEM